MYDNATMIKNEIRSFGEENGFRASVQGKGLVCNRHYVVATDIHHNKRNNIDNIGSECSWSIFFQPIYYKQFLQAEPVKITKFNAMHTNGCSTNEEKLVISKKKLVIMVNKKICLQRSTQINGSEKRQKN